MKLNRYPVALAAAFAATFAAASPAAAMSIDEGSFKTADACVNADISGRAYDLAFNGGGTLRLEGKDLTKLVEDCEKSTGTKAETFRGMTRFELTVKPL